MSLTGALQIGRSGLLSQQAALEVTGNNLANVATRGYHRQTVSLSPALNQEIQQGVFVGRGVQIEAITRQIDEALEARLRSAVADQSRSSTSQELLSQVEAIQNEFSGVDLSTKLGEFFNAWSNLTNNPQDVSLRSLVLSESQTLANFVQGLRTDLTTLRTQTDKSTQSAVEAVNSLLNQVESLNERIAVSGGYAGGAAGLRDQRDVALEELAQYLDISTIESATGVVDVYVGSLPIVLNGKSRGVELQTRNIDGESTTQLVIADDKSPLDLSAGKLGALLSFREGDLAEAIGTIDNFANQLIWQVNRIHSQGQGVDLYQSVTGETKINDTTLALNDASLELPFTPGHGSFQVHVTQASTGQRIAATVRIDLDGINAASDTTLDDVISQLNAMANLDASATADGRLVIAGASGDFRVSFSDDSSGFLAAMGLNTFFTGSSGQDIGVNQALVQSPRLLAAAQGHVAGDNSNALAIAALREQPLDDLSGFSLSGYWNRHVEDYAARLSAARQQVSADTVVRENLAAQQQSISGVNADEEAIDLIRFQRAYQASARFLTVVDELMQTLLSIV